jgi:hypothetical protein
VSRQLLITLAAALAVIGIALYSTVKVNKAHLLTLEGKIDNVRVISVTPESTLVIVDFTATNPAKIRFEVRDLTLERIEKDKDPLRGDVLSRAELLRYMEYSKVPQANPPIGSGERVNGGETVKRMIAARFDVPVGGLGIATYRIGFLDYNNVAAKIEGKKP